VTGALKLHCHSRLNSQFNPGKFVLGRWTLTPLNIQCHSTLNSQFKLHKFPELNKNIFTYFSIWGIQEPAHKSRLLKSIDHNVIGTACDEVFNALNRDAQLINLTHQY